MWNCSRFSFSLFVFDSVSNLSHLFQSFPTEDCSCVQICCKQLLQYCNVSPIGTLVSYCAYVQCNGKIEYYADWKTWVWQFKCIRQDWMTAASACVCQKLIEFVYGTWFARKGVRRAHTPYAHISDALFLCSVFIKWLQSVLSKQDIFIFESNVRVERNFIFCHIFLK